MVNKHEQTNPQTEETFSKSEAFFLKNKKIIAIALLAIIAVVVGASLYKSYVLEPKENKASTAIAKGQEYFNNEQFDKALNGDGASFPGFAKMASQHSGTKAGNLANLYAGLCYANMDKWAEAVQHLSSFSAKDDAMVSPAALGALGNAYAHVNELDKAVETLKKAAQKADAKAEEKTNNSLSPTFLVQAAEILESQGKKAEALKIYQEVKRKYVNAMVSMEIDKYIERATAE